jgi:hypothetical protein
MRQVIFRTQLAYISYIFDETIILHRERIIPRKIIMKRACVYADRYYAYCECRQYKS